MADAVVIPGANYPAVAPLTLFASEVAELRGATVHRHSWTQPVPTDFGPVREGWVRDEITPLLATVGGSPLLIGKSLGTLTAGLAAQRSLPAVWITPLLYQPWAAAPLERATAPFLLVGGTADKAWDGELARGLTPHVLEVEGADHGMYVPGPLTDTIAVLAQVVLAVEAFLEAIDWPN